MQEESCFYQNEPDLNQKHSIQPHFRNQKVFSSGHFGQSPGNLQSSKKCDEPIYIEPDKIALQTTTKNANIGG